MDFSEARQIMLDDPLTRWVFPIYLGAVFIEATWSRLGRHNLYETRDTAVSFSMLIGSGLIEILPKLVWIAILIEVHELSPLRDLVDRQAWCWVVLFFLDDLTYYAFHRMNHEVRFLWAGHVNHHSSQYMNFGTALRQGVGERVYKPLFWLWLAFAGFDPAMILMMMGLNLTYQFWTHTEAVRRMPAWFEAVFNTPSHHRVHHGSNIRYLDRNHAGVLIVWDKLFGTFSPEIDHEPVVYGLTQNLETLNPLRVLSHGYIEILSDMGRSTKWADRFKYLFMPPGWSHDGPDRRASTLRASLSNVGTSEQRKGSESG